jgi:hypothetical protein
MYIFSINTDSSIICWPIYVLKPAKNLLPSHGQTRQLAIFVKRFCQGNRHILYTVDKRLAHEQMSTNSSAHHACMLYFLLSPAFVKNSTVREK